MNYWGAMPPAPLVSTGLSVRTLGGGGTSKTCRSVQGGSKFDEYGVYALTMLQLDLLLNVTFY